MTIQNQKLQRQILQNITRPKSQKIDGTIIQNYAQMVDNIQQAYNKSDAQNETSDFFVHLGNNEGKYESEFETDFQLKTDYLLQTHYPSPLTYCQLVSVIHFKIPPANSSTMENLGNLLLNPKTNETIRYLLLKYVMIPDFETLFPANLINSIISNLNPTQFKTKEYERDVIPTIMIIPVIFPRIKQQSQRDKILLELEQILGLIDRNVLRMFYGTTISQFLNLPEFRTKLSFVTNKMKVFQSWFNKQKHQSTTYQLFAEYAIFNQQYLNTREIDKLLNSFIENPAKSLPAFVRLASFYCFGNNIFYQNAGVVDINQLQMKNVKQDPFSKDLLDQKFTMLLSKLSVDWSNMQSMSKKCLIFTPDQSEKNTYLSAEYIQYNYFWLHPFLSMTESNSLTIELFDIIKLFVHQCPSYFSEMIANNSSLTEQTQIIIILAIFNLNQHHFTEVLKSNVTKDQILKTAGYFLFNGIFQNKFDSTVVTIFSDKFDVLRLSQQSKQILQKCMNWLNSCSDDQLIDALRFYSRLLEQFRTDNSGKETQNIIFVLNHIKSRLLQCKQPIKIKNPNLLFESIIILYSLTEFPTNGSTIMIHLRDTLKLYQEIFSECYLKGINFVQVILNKKLALKSISCLVNNAKTQENTQKQKMESELYNLINQSVYNNRSNDSNHLLLVNRLLYQAIVYSQDFQLQAGYKQHEVTNFVQSLQIQEDTQKDYIFSDNRQTENKQVDINYFDFLDLVIDQQQVQINFTRNINDFAEIFQQIRLKFNPDKFSEALCSIVDDDKYKLQDNYAQVIIHYCSKLFKSSEKQLSEQLSIGFIINAACYNKTRIPTYDELCQPWFYIDELGSYTFVFLVFVFINTPLNKSFTDNLSLFSSLYGILKKIVNFPTLYKDAFVVVDKIQVKDVIFEHKTSLFTSKFPQDFQNYQKIKQDFLKNHLCSTNMCQIIERTFFVLSYLLSEEFSKKMDLVLEELQKFKLSECIQKDDIGITSTVVFNKIVLQLLLISKIRNNNQNIISVLSCQDEVFLKYLIKTLSPMQSNASIIQSNSYCQFTDFQLNTDNMNQSDMKLTNQKRLITLSQLNANLFDSNITIQSIHKLLHNIVQQQTKDESANQYTSLIFKTYLRNIITYEKFVEYLQYILESDNKNLEKKTAGVRSLQISYQEHENLTDYGLHEQNKQAIFDPIEFQQQRSLNIDTNYYSDDQEDLPLTESLSLLTFEYNDPQYSDSDLFLRFVALKTLLEELILDSGKIPCITYSEQFITLNLDTLFYELDSNDSKTCKIQLSLAQYVFDLCSSQSAFNNEYFILMKDRVHLGSRIRYAFKKNVSDQFANSYFFVAALITLSLFLRNNQNFGSSSQLVFQSLTQSKSVPIDLRTILVQCQPKRSLKFFDDLLNKISIFAPGQLWFIQNLTTTTFSSKYFCRDVNYIFEKFHNDYFTLESANHIQFLPVYQSTESDTSLISRKDYSANEIVLDNDINQSTKTVELTEFFLHSFFNMLSTLFQEQIECRGENNTIGVTLNQIVNRFLSFFTCGESEFDQLIIKLVQFYANNEQFIKQYQVKPQSLQKSVIKLAQVKQRIGEKKNVTPKISISENQCKPKLPPQKDVIISNVSEMHHCNFSLHVIELIFTNVSQNSEKFGYLLAILSKFIRRDYFINLYEAATNFKNKETEFIYGIAVRQIFARILTNESGNEKFLQQNNEKIAAVISQLVASGIYSGVHSKQIKNSEADSSTRESSSFSQQRFRRLKHQQYSSTCDEFYLKDCLNIDIQGSNFLLEIVQFPNSSDHKYFNYFLQQYLTQTGISIFQDYKLVSNFLYTITVKLIYNCFDYSFELTTLDIPPWHQSDIYYLSTVDKILGGNSSSYPLQDVPVLRNNTIQKTIATRNHLYDAINETMKFVITQNSLEEKIMFDQLQLQSLMKQLIALFINHLFLVNNFPHETLYQDIQLWEEIFVRVLIVSILSYNGNDPNLLSQIRNIMLIFEKMFSIFQCNTLALPVLHVLYFVFKNEFPQQSIIQKEISEYTIYQQCKFQFLHSNDIIQCQNIKSSLTKKQLDIINQFSIKQQNSLTIKKREVAIQQCFDRQFSLKYGLAKYSTQYNSYLDKQLQLILSASKLDDSIDIFTVKSFYGLYKQFLPTVNENFQQLPLQNISQMQKLALNTLHLVVILIVKPNLSQFSFQDIINQFVFLLEHEEQSPIRDLFKTLLQSEMSGNAKDLNFERLFNKIKTGVEDFLYAVLVYALHSKYYEIPALIIIGLIGMSFGVNRREITKRQPLLGLLISHKSNKNCSSTAKQAIDKIVNLFDLVRCSYEFEDGIEIVLERADKQFDMLHTTFGNQYFHELLQIQTQTIIDKSKEST